MFCETNDLGTSDPFGEWILLPPKFVNSLTVLFSRPWEVESGFPAWGDKTPSVGCGGQDAGEVVEGRGGGVVCDSR